MGKKLTQEEYIAKARAIHGNKYDYSKVLYIVYREPIIIICPEHGEKEMYPQRHLVGSGCPNCGVLNRQKNKSKKKYGKRTKEIFLQQANEIHNNKYDYSLVAEYTNDSIITIICSIHGEFEQKVSKHLVRKQGCPKCGINSIKEFFTDTKEDFIRKAKEIHGDRYDYSLVEYKGSKFKVWIKCSDHGPFFKRPNAHLTMKEGCPVCSSYVSKEERDLYLWFKDILKPLEVQQSYRPDWLKFGGTSKSKELDIYIPELNLAVEYNGSYWHSSENKSIDYHKIKYKKCLENNINLIHIFEFENLNKWKRKLFNYIRSPYCYDIIFKNNKRTVQEYVLYGQSYIRKIK